MYKLKPFLLFLIPILLACVYASLTYSSLNVQRLVNMDRTLSLLSIHQAQDFQAWSGVFSRYHFRHLGPFHFYYLALVDNFLDFIPNMHARARWGALFFNTCALSGAFFILAHYFKFGSLLLLLSTFLIATSKWIGLYFADYWNPNFVPTLSLLFISLLMALLSEGRSFIQTHNRNNVRKLLLALSFATLIAEVLIQIHIGVALVVSGLYLFILLKTFFMLRRVITFKQILPYLLITFGISCFLWLPVIYDAFVFDNFGNLGRIFSFFQQPREKIPFQLAVSYFIKYLSNTTFIKGHIYQILSITLFCLGLISSFHILINKKFSKNTKETALIFLYFVLLVLFSIMQVSGVYMLYMMAMGYLLLPLAIFVLSLWIDFYLEKKRKLHLCITGCYFTLFFIVVYFYPVKQFPRRSSELQTRVEQTINKIDFQDDSVYHFQFSSPAPYKYVSRVILEVSLQGKTICVDEKWGYRYGDALRCDYLKKTNKYDDYRIQRIEFFYTKDGSVDFIRK